MNKGIMLAIVLLVATTVAAQDTQPALQTVDTPEALVENVTTWLEGRLVPPFNWMVPSAVAIIAGYYWGKRKKVTT